MIEVDFCERSVTVKNESRSLHLERDSECSLNLTLDFNFMNFNFGCSNFVDLTRRAGTCVSLYVIPTALFLSKVLRKELFVSVNCEGTVSLILGSLQLEVLSFFSSRNLCQNYSERHQCLPSATTLYVDVFPHTISCDDVREKDSESHSPYHALCELSSGLCIRSESVSFAENRLLGRRSRRAPAAVRDPQIV